ncbi:helix-turn-helix transcriptional regulator [Streptomyces sp. NPDC047315]|uniref:response regulator transcription factor n=1 Tax=Streptomyces sp. NPDC047315 TaxID=3155142 RepID=UPI0033C90585
MVSSRLGADPKQRSALQVLTPREREVLAVMAAGESNRALSRRLGIAERTVKSHLTSITRKLGLKSRVEVVLLSIGMSEAGTTAVAGKTVAGKTEAARSEHAAGDRR